MRPGGGMVDTGDLKSLARMGVPVRLRLGVHAGIAQLVELLICNQPVGGSSPSASTFSWLRGFYRLYS